VAAAAALCVGAASSAGAGDGRTRAEPPSLVDCRQAGWIAEPQQVLHCAGCLVQWLLRCQS